MLVDATAVAEVHTLVACVRQGPLATAAPPDPVDHVPPRAALRRHDRLVGSLATVAQVEGVPHEGLAQPGEAGNAGDQVDVGRPDDADLWAGVHRTARRHGFLTITCSVVYRWMRTPANSSASAPPPCPRAVA